jgi:hypothetical protein
MVARCAHTGTFWSGWTSLFPYGMKRITSGGRRFARNLVSRFATRFWILISMMRISDLPTTSTLFLGSRRKFAL